MEIKKYSALSLREEQALAIEINAGNEHAMHRLVQANLKFVVAVCANYRDRGLSMVDLINEGNLGLIRAARRFDGAREFKFISYAVWWIRQGILTALAEQTRCLKLTVSHIEVMRKITGSLQKLEQKFHRLPSSEEISKDTGFSRNVIMKVRRISFAAPSSGRPQDPEWNGDLKEQIKDENAECPEKAASAHLLRKHVKSLLGVLGEREQKVIMLSHGIGCQTQYSLREIAARLNVTCECVRQIRFRALQKLCKPARRLELILAKSGHGHSQERQHGSLHFRDAPPSVSCLSITSAIPRPPIRASAETHNWLGRVHT